MWMGDWLRDRARRERFVRTRVKGKHTIFIAIPLIVITTIPTAVYRQITPLSSLTYPGYPSLSALIPVRSLLTLAQRKSSYVQMLAFYSTDLEHRTR